MCRKSRRLKLSLLLLAILAETTVLGAGGMPAEALGTVCYDVRYKLGGLASEIHAELAKYFPVEYPHSIQRPSSSRRRYSGCLSVLIT